MEGCELGNALAGELEHIGEGGLIKCDLLTRTLQFHVFVPGGHDDVEIDLCRCILLVAKIEKGGALNDPDTDGGD